MSLNTQSLIQYATLQYHQDERFQRFVRNAIAEMELNLPISVVLGLTNSENNLIAKVLLDQYSALYENLPC